jgi:serine/threonine protein kinase, bacterial
MSADDPDTQAGAANDETEVIGDASAADRADAQPDHAWSDEGDDADDAERHESHPWSVVTGQAAALVSVGAAVAAITVLAGWFMLHNDRPTSPPVAGPTFTSSIVAAPVSPPAPAPTTTTAPPAPDPLYALPACYGKYEITMEPEATPLFCRHHFYEDLKWTKWTASGADATGLQQLQNCNPGCAQGEVFRNQVELHFTGAAAPSPESGCPAGLRYYTQLIAAYPSGPAPDLGVPSTEITPTRYNGMPALRWNNLQPWCLP